jgi:hypothetical protein
VVTILREEEQPRVEALFIWNVNIFLEIAQPKHFDNANMGLLGRKWAHPGRNSPF